MKKFRTYLDKDPEPEPQQEQKEEDKPILKKVPKPKRRVLPVPKNLYDDLRRPNNTFVFYGERKGDFA